MISLLFSLIGAFIWVPYRLIMGILKIVFEIFFWMWIELLFGKQKRRW